MTETLLTKLKREAREKYAQDSGEKAHNLLSAEDLDELIVNTLKQAAEALEGIKKDCGTYKSNDTGVCRVCDYTPTMRHAHNSALTDAQRLLGEDNENV